MSTLRGILSHELGVAEDGLQEVVEVVRDAAGHLSERGELLGLEHLRLELALGGGVVHDREHALELPVAPGERGEGHGEVQGGASSSRRDATSNTRTGDSGDRRGARRQVPVVAGK